MDPTGGNAEAGVERHCGSEPRAAKNVASLPTLLRHLRDLQKLFAVRGFLVKHK